MSGLSWLWNGWRHVTLESTLAKRCDWPDKAKPGPGGGPKGDLFIEAQVQFHPTFQRQGKNVRSDVKVPVAIAMLGGKVEVPTLKGVVMLSIPPGTSSDQVLRIRGQGIPAGPVPGDHLARVVITVAKTLSDDTKAAIRKHLPTA